MSKTFFQFFYHSTSNCLSFSALIKELKPFMKNKNHEKHRLECEGWDSNPRTPTRLGPQPSAFDLAWLPSLLCHYKKVVHVIKSYVSAFFKKRIFPVITTSFCLHQYQTERIIP